MNKKKVIALSVAAVFVGISIWLAGFSYGRGHVLVEKAEAHQWSQWGDPTAPAETDAHGLRYIQFRHCTNCGLSEFRTVLKTR